MAWRWSHTRPARPVRAWLLIVTLGLLVAGAGCNSGSEEVATQPVSTTAPSPTSPQTTAPATTQPPTTQPPTTQTTLPPTTRAPVPTTLARQRIDLLSAIDAGLVEAQPTGNGLQSVRLTLTSKAGHPLDIDIEPGTVFASRSGGVQSMVSRASRTASLSPGASTDVTVDAACANMNLRTPSSSNSFDIKGSGNADLNSLLALSALSRESFRVQQFAIWTLTDNPTRAGFVGLGTGGAGSGPSDDEINSIRSLFQRAGVNPANYRATR